MRNKKRSTRRTDRDAPSALSARKPIYLYGLRSDGISLSEVGEDGNLSCYLSTSALLVSPLPTKYMLDTCRISLYP